MTTIGINRELLTDLIGTLEEYHRVCRDCGESPHGMRVCPVAQRLLRGRQLLVLAPVFANPGPYVYNVSVMPKSLRETVNIARGIVARHPEESHEPFHSRVLEHLDLLGRECDRKRPVGVGGKHDDLHTPECGCGV